MNDDSESTLFEPEVILPAQTSVDARWACDTSGPIALMLAVLEDAARCIATGRRRRHAGIGRLAAEAEAWVRSDSGAWPFAFANICEVLGLDVDAARASLLAHGDAPTDVRRVPVWHIARGHGRTAVRPARATRRAA